MKEAFKRALKPIWHRYLRLRFLMRLLYDFFWDSILLLRYTHDGRSDKRKAQQENAILKMYHGIEKGLCLSQPRPGFGKVKIRHLTRKIEEWLDLHGPSPLVVSAIGSLKNYQQFNRDHKQKNEFLDSWLDRVGESYLSSEERFDINSAIEEGGVKQLTRAEVVSAVSNTNFDFFSSRHSMRNFSTKPVPPEMIVEAIKMAQRAPSACNRQGPKVYAFRDAISALKYQPGNTGFGDSASYGLVITSDLTSFSGAGERHQAYVDGGIFAMSLNYAFHSLGLGACMLAWNADRKHDTKTKQSLNIPDSEIIVMMMAVGHLPEQFKVACSARRKVDEVLSLR